jgi:hypothetical protein
MSTRWKKEQRDKVRKAFSQRRRSSDEMERFIDKAEEFLPIVEHERQQGTRKTATAQLTQLANAAAALSQSVSVLGGGAQAHLVAVGQGLARRQDTTASVKGRLRRLVRETVVVEMGREDLALGEPTLLLKRLDRYARMLALWCEIAAAKKASKGKRSKDALSRRLAEYLYLWWLVSFGRRPSISANGEFHRVAQEIAQMYAIKIGHVTLKNCVSPYADYAANHLDILRESSNETPARGVFSLT